MPIVILTAFVLVAMFLAFEGEAEITSTTESKQAERILAEGFPQEAANGQAITRSSSYGPRTATFRRLQRGGWVGLIKDRPELSSSRSTRRWVQRPCYWVGGATSGSPRGGHPGVASWRTG